MPTLIVLSLAPVAVAFVLLALRDPIRVALPVYAVVVPFGSGIAVFGRGFGSLSSLLGIVLGLGLLIQLVVGRRRSVRIPATVPAWLALLALTGLTVFWSLDPGRTAAGFLSFGSLILIYVLIALIRFERAELTRFENAILLGGVLAAGYGAAQLLFLGGLPVGDSGSQRFGNDLLGPNNQAAALILPLAIALGRLVQRSGRQRIVPVAAIVVMLVGIVMTGSRGGLLAMAAALAVSALASREGRRLLLGWSAVGLAFVTVLVIVQPAGIGERILSHGLDGSTNSDLSSGRSEIWEIAKYSCPTYCATGAGWENFPVLYERNQSFVAGSRVLVHGVAYEAHNIWILAAMELGLLGVVLLLAGLGLAVRSVLRLPERLRGPPLAAVVGTIVSGFFLSNLEFKFWWMALIYAVVVHNYADDGGAPGPVPDAPETHPWGHVAASKISI